jgi:hypothetical protein
VSSVAKKAVIRGPSAEVAYRTTSTSLCPSLYKHRSLAASASVVLGHFQRVAETLMSAAFHPSVRLEQWLFLYQLQDTLGVPAYQRRHANACSCRCPSRNEVSSAEPPGSVGADSPIFGTMLRSIESGPAIISPHKESSLKLQTSHQTSTTCQLQQTVA